MARTKSSENENSEDEVILRVKRKSLTESDLKNYDHNHQQQQNSSLLLSSTAPSISLPSSSLSDYCIEKKNDFFCIESYNCVENSINAMPGENNFLISNMYDRRKSSIDLSGIKFLLESDQIEVWRQDENPLAIPNIEENNCTATIAANPTSEMATGTTATNVNSTSSDDNEKFDNNHLRSSFKRESFLRHSINTFFRRSFSRSLPNRSTRLNSNNQSLLENSKPVNVCKLDNHLQDEESDYLTQLNNTNDQARIIRLFRTNSASSYSSSGRSTSSVSLGIRSSSSSPMAPLQSQSETHGQSIIGLNTIGRSPSYHSTHKLDSKSSKQLTLSTPVTASTGRSISPHPKSSTALVSAKNEIPEKEKKRKELSSSRQKKFHRHFQQVPKDEKVLNYFSCALVSDILLQGHLYITEQHFAFYSNVFGFVTKLLIPTASVIKISKEKTAKIIPNAVGVATADERHVFGSFMSREAAFRLMCSVCQPLEPIENIIVPKVPDVEVSEEYSVEDDSSCSISGNESPPQLVDSTTTTSDASQTIRQRKIPVIEAPNISDVVDSKIEDIPELAKIIVTPPCSSNTPVKISKSPPPRIVSPSSNAIKLKFPTDFHIVYLGLVLTIVLAMLSGFLFYRILDIEAKTNFRSSLDFKWDSDSDEDVYAKALKWQKEMQTKSTEEAQNILNTNLEQIAKVRRSLETLSLLIHDKNVPLENDNRGYVKDTESSYNREETT